MKIRDFKTFSQGEEVLHYTCQSIEPTRLKSKRIRMVGEQFGIEAREVLAIPKSLFKKLGMFIRSSEEMQVNAEKVLRDL